MPLATGLNEKPRTKANLRWPGPGVGDYPLSLHGDGCRLGELERQLALGGEQGYVLVRLGFVGTLGIALGLALRSGD